jgi:hypothetical protein
MGWGEDEGAVGGMREYMARAHCSCLVDPGILLLSVLHFFCCSVSPTPSTS